MSPLGGCLVLGEQDLCLQIVEVKGFVSALIKKPEDAAKLL